MQERTPATEFTRCFAPDLRAPQATRGFCRDVLECYGLVALASIVELLVSELVTNAVRHAEPPLAVHVRCAGAVVRIEVDDGAPHDLPKLEPPDQRDLRGRGLYIVERLAARWGVHPNGRGKTVWFEVEP